MPDYYDPTKEVETVVEAQGDQSGRRRWEVKRELVRRERDEDENVPRHKSFLMTRTEDVGIDASLGQHRTVEQDSNWRASKGFVCEVCNVGYNDSISWMEHINSVRHNSALGMNMKVEKVTADRVKEKLERL